MRMERKNLKDIIMKNTTFIVLIVYYLFLNCYVLNIYVVHISIDDVRKSRKIANVKTICVEEFDRIIVYKSSESVSCIIV